MGVMYYQLAHPLAPFWQYYLLFVVVYGCASGIAYAISVLCPNSIAQLVGVLVVLVCMMFSGADPTLPQLRDKELLGGVLYIPTFTSYIRWAQEAYYKLEISKYKGIYDTQSGIKV